MVCQNGKRKFEGRKAADALAEQLANLPQFFVKGQPIGQVSSFTYLGRVLNSEDDDLEACQRNIERSRAKWGALSRLLRSQRASLAMHTRMYLVVVSTVRLYGSETWTFTPRIQQLLTSFHVGCARHLTRMYVHPTYTEDNPEDLTWVYPSAQSTLQRCGRLQPIMHYVNLRWERFFLNYLKTSPSFSDSTKQTTASHVRNFNRFLYQQYTQFDRLMVKGYASKLSCIPCLRLVCWVGVIFGAVSFGSVQQFHHCRRVLLARVAKVDWNF